MVDAVSRGHHDLAFDRIGSVQEEQNGSDGKAHGEGRKKDHLDKLPTHALPPHYAMTDGTAHQRPGLGNRGSRRRGAFILGNVGAISPSSNCAMGWLAPAPLSSLGRSMEMPKRGENKTALQGPGRAANSAVLPSPRPSGAHVPCG